jgi:hypothetical protein
MKLVRFVIDDNGVSYEAVSSYPFEVIEDIVKHMMEMFPDRNVRDVRIIERSENSFEEKFVF